MKPLAPSTDKPPGFWAHLKSPLPELPRSGLWLWTAMLSVGFVLSFALALRDADVASAHGVLGAVSVMWLMASALLCALVGHGAHGLRRGMRNKAAVASAFLGDLLGLAWMGLCGLLPLRFVLPSYSISRSIRD